MTCQDSFHEVAFNISFWTRNISSARILFWRGVQRFELHYVKHNNYVVEMHNSGLSECKSNTVDNRQALGNK